MSTKISLSYDNKTHVFQECGDEENIHIQIQNDKIKATFSLDLYHIVSLSRSASYEMLERQAAIDDAKIRKHVEETVAARSKSNSFSAMFGILVYGSVEDPVEQQIKSGVEYYTKRRDELAKLLDRVKANRNQPFYFGLEEIL